MSTEQNAVVRVERRGRVAIVTMDDPKHLNPLQNTPAGSEEQLAEAIVGLERDDEIRVIVLTGAGRAFSAGADTREQSRRYTADETVLRSLSASPMVDEERSWAMWYVLERCTKPLIAAVHGWAIAGGWEVALWCDMIIADETAKFSFKEIDLGWTPAFGTLFAGRVAGRWKAAELCYTGRVIDAVEADDMGLVTRVVPEGTALDASIALAEEIAQHAMPVLAATRRALNRAIASQMEWEMNRRDFALVGLCESGAEARGRWQAEIAARKDQKADTA